MNSELPADGYHKRVDVDPRAHRIEVHLTMIPKPDSPGEVVIISTGAELTASGVLGPNGEPSVEIRELSMDEKRAMVLDWLRASVGQ